MSATPGQTVGPFLSIGLDWPDGRYAVRAVTPGAFWIRGVLLDGAGEPVADGMIETWDGHRFARSLTAADGAWAVHTLMPEAGYLAVSVFARGLLDRLITRIHFDGAEPALAAIPQDGGYRFDIHLQGPHETVFFAIR